MKQERVAYIDIVRGMVIVLMVIGHSGAPYQIVRGIYGFHMPFFFILSGILYDVNKWEKRGISELVKCKWKAYVVPYFWLCLLNLIINMPIEIVGHNHLRGRELFVATIKHAFWSVYSFGNASKMPNCTPLWFLLCLFVSNIYLYALVTKVKNKERQIFICIMAVGVDLLLSYLNVIQLPWHVDIALIGMTFMYIGICVRETGILNVLSNNLFLQVGLFGIGVYCIYTNPRIDINMNVVNNVVLMIVGASCISITLIAFVKRFMAKSPMLEFMGKNTILFMAFNYAINTYSYGFWNMIPVLNKLQYTWWMSSIVNVIVVCIFAILYNRMKTKFPKIALY